MLITRKSILSGVKHTMVIDVTEEQYYDWLNGKLIQKAMPNLSPDDREFMINGITPEEWGNTFKPKDDE